MMTKSLKPARTEPRRFAAPGRLYGQARENYEYAIANGHPPVAHKVACVDFDQTIFPWGGLMDRRKQPFDRARDAVQMLKDKGYTVAIFTSRLSTRWALHELGYGGKFAIGIDQLAAVQEFKHAQEDYISDMLSVNGIPFDEITAEKIPAQVYFDDKAINVSESEDLYDRVVEFLAA